MIGWVTSGAAAATCSVYPSSNSCFGNASVDLPVIVKGRLAELGMLFPRSGGRSAAWENEPRASANIRCLFIQGTEYPLNRHFIAHRVQVCLPELAKKQVPLQARRMVLLLLALPVMLLLLAQQAGWVRRELQEAHQTVLVARSLVLPASPRLEAVRVS